MTAKTANVASEKFDAALPGVPDVLGHEFARTTWCVTVEIGTKVEHLTDARFWTQIAHMFRLGDHVEVMPQDGSSLSFLIVRNIDRNLVKMGLIQHVDFEDAAIPTQDIGDYEIKWRGRAGFGVLRKSDLALLRTGFQTRNEAIAWAVEQERSFAA